MTNSFDEKPFIVVPNFISESRALYLAREFRRDANEQEFKGDFVKSSQCKYGYKPFLELLCEKVELMNHLVGEPVLPSYTYARNYKYGSQLPFHTDRPSCEISVTVHLNGDHPWNLMIEDYTKKLNLISLNPGDAVVYLGTEAVHGRDGLYHGINYTQVFLHYVRSGGEFFDYAFDRPFLQKMERFKIEEELRKNQEV